MEIRKVSIIIGIIAIVVGFMYLVVKVAKRNLQYKNEHRQFETMREVYFFFKCTDLIFKSLLNFLAVKLSLFLWENAA